VAVTSGLVLPPPIGSPIGFSPFSASPSIVQLTNIANTPPAPTTSPFTFGRVGLGVQVQLTEITYPPLFTVPLVMIPAPGAGKLIYVRAVFTRLQKPAGAWTNSGTNARVQYTGQTQSLGSPSMAFLVGGGTIQTLMVDAVAQTLTGGGVNASVEIQTTSQANPGAQTGTLVFVIFYDILNVGF
jgi:hypothetical protein